MLVPLAISTPYLSRAWLLPYLTAPQLTSSPSAGGKIIDAVTGVAAMVLTARHSRGRAPTPHRPPEQGTILEPVVEH